MDAGGSLMNIQSMGHPKRELINDLHYGEFYLLVMKSVPLL